jgi:hypothetical protein
MFASRYVLYGTFDGEPFSYSTKINLNMNQDILSLNLMKLRGSLGNVPQKRKNLLLELDIYRTVSPFSRVQFLLFKLIKLFKFIQYKLYS